VESSVRETPQLRGNRDLQTPAGTGIIDVSYLDRLMNHLL
jgi:hypothetical protein